jgi:5-methylcytosine-specific restriction endonuclease McrA
MALTKRETPQHIELTPLAIQRRDDKLCLVCAKPKADWGTRNRNFRCCSAECTKQFWMKTELVIVKNWVLLRLKVFERDNYTCVKCGAKPTCIISAYHGTLYDEPERIIPAISKLIGDHIRPIALGGDQWDPDNIQTLCIACNKIKTAQDAKAIGKARKFGIDKTKQLELSCF